MLLSAIAVYPILPTSCFAKRKKARAGLCEWISSRIKAEQPTRFCMLKCFIITFVVQGGKGLTDVPACVVVNNS